MEPEMIKLQDKWMEQAIVGISAKVADAVEMVQKAKDVTANLEGVLIQAQSALEELYILMGLRSEQTDTMKNEGESSGTQD